MKQFILIGLISLLRADSFSQKAIISRESCQNWPEIKEAQISNDGMYVLYLIRNVGQGSSLIIQSVDKSFKRCYPISRSSGYANFSYDSEIAVFQIAGDSLCILQLKTKKEEYLQKVESFSLIQNSGNKYLAVFFVNKSLIV